MNRMMYMAALGLLGLSAGYACQLVPLLVSERNTVDEPFDIVLEVAGDTLRAAIVNRSSSEQTMLHDPYVQPARLVLRDKRGRNVEPFDTRSVKKYDNAVHAWMYETLAPSGRRVLVEAAIERDAKRTYRIAWGPYIFEGLAAGPYRAHVVWESEHDTWTDDGVSGEVEDVWKGTVVSNEVGLKLKP